MQRYPFPLYIVLVHSKNKNVFEVVSKVEHENDKGVMHFKRPDLYFEAMRGRRRHIPLSKVKQCGQAFMWLPESLLE